MRFGVHLESKTWTAAQVKAFRLMVNRSVGWAEWDDELLAQELTDPESLDFDLSLTGFDDHEIDDLLSDPGADDRANIVPPVPEHPAARLGDAWVMGEHRLLPSLQVAYVWHASILTREVLDGLLRIGSLYPLQIIWNKGRTVLTRTQYWYQHEPVARTE